MTNQADAKANSTDTAVLAKGSSLSLFGSAGGAALTLALVFVVTWGLGADEGGVFFEAIALFNIAIVAVAVGADTGLVRFTSRSLVFQDLAGQTRMLTVGLVPVLVIGIVTAAVGFALAPSLGNSLGGPDHADDIATMIRILSFFVPVGALNLAILGATRGYGTMVPTVVAERLGRPLVQLFLGGSAILLGASAGWLATAWAVGFASSLLAASMWLLRLRHRNHRDGQHPEGSLLAVAKEFWAFTLPRAFAAMFRVAVLWLDVLLVGALMSPRDAAIYTVATRIIQMGSLALDAIGQAVEPMFSRLLAGNHHERTGTLYQVAAAWLISLTWPLFIAAMVFASTVLGLFGPDFGEAAPVVVILALSSLLGTGLGSIDILLVMAGKSVWSLWNAGAALGANIVLNLLLIPEMGLNGAALAWAISRVLANVLPFLEMRTLLPVNPAGAGWRAAAVASIATFGVIGLAMRLLFGESVLVVAAYVAIAGSAYSWILWTWRHKLDFAAFAGLLQNRLNNGRGRP